MLFPDLWPPHWHHPLSEWGRCTGGSCLWAAAAAAPLVRGSFASFLSGCTNDLGEARRHFKNIYFLCSWVALQSLLFLDLSFLCAIIQHDLNLNVPTSRRDKSVLKEVGCIRITFISFDAWLIWESSNPLKPVITVFRRGEKRNRIKRTSDISNSILKKNFSFFFNFPFWHFKWHTRQNFLCCHLPCCTWSIMTTLILKLRHLTVIEH